MAGNRPRSREKYVTGGSQGVKKRGSGLGTGPVGSGIGPAGGSSGGYTGGGAEGGSSSSGRQVRASGGGKNWIGIIIAIVVLLGGGGGLSGILGTLLGGGSGDTGGGSPIGSLLNSGTTSSGWELSRNTGVLDNNVASGAREKRTQIVGNGNDKVTIMVYMCGTDLESRSGMATSDLQEMLAADISDNVNVIVYTGGCNKWQNNVVSSSVNQIYQVKDGKLKVLNRNAGSASMTDPNTLVSFIKYCKTNFPANRNQLIFWDHGGGSISGFGYDEKNKNSGSMDLSEINQALKSSGVSFDFIGFDACLMATLENALMLTPYADYMIASEETEPGVGWYYTNWLTKLSKNTAMPTIEIGKNIVDDFVDTCAKKCAGQKTTLSVVDLAELEKTVPQKLKDFSKSASQLIQNNEYKTVSDARYSTREFAPSNAIDQVDLVHLASNLGTEESKELANALLSTVKYNRTSNNMTNAYGLSIYFPYKKVSSVDSVVDTYEAIGMDEEYARCIQAFASLEVSGQSTTGGSSSVLPSLLGSIIGGTGSSSSANGNADVISGMLGSLLSGQLNNIVGLDRSNTDFLDESAINKENVSQYLANNYFDASALKWTKNNKDQNILKLTEAQWSLVHSLELNMFYDDGEGYIDLGYDNVFEFDDSGNLIGDTDRTWLAINGQPVAYYYLDTLDDGQNYTITGRVPALLNGERVNLMLVFDNAHPRGYIAGASYDYVSGETDTIAKSMTELKVGDKLDFICDYYSYDGKYEDSYYIGEQMTVTDNMTISNVNVGDGEIRVMYRFTDIYNQQYWTPAIKQ